MPDRPLPKQSASMTWWHLAKGVKWEPLPHQKRIQEKCPAHEKASEPFTCLWAEKKINSVVNVWGSWASSNIETVYLLMSETGFFGEQGTGKPRIHLRRPEQNDQREQTSKQRTSKFQKHFSHEFGTECGNERALSCGYYVAPKSIEMPKGPLSRSNDVIPTNLLGPQSTNAWTG